MVGKGETTIFWKDLWLWGQPICDQLSVLFNLVVDKDSTFKYKMPACYIAGLEGVMALKSVF